MRRKKLLWIDASTAIGIASLTSLALSMASKESYEYVNPYVRFWLIVVIGVAVQGLHALSKFRDGTFQRNQDEEKARLPVGGDTDNLPPKG